MSRTVERTLLLVVDALMLTAAGMLFYHGRFEWGWFGDTLRDVPTVAPAMLVLTLFWLVTFAFAGLYRERYAASRFDELVSLAKVVTVGVLILVFAIFIDTLEAGSSRTALLGYWGAVFSFTAVGRIGVRSVQKALILRGYGRHRALIV